MTARNLKHLDLTHERWGLVINLGDNFTVSGSISKDNKSLKKDRKLNKYIDIPHKQMCNFGEKVKIFLK